MNSKVSRVFFWIFIALVLVYLLISIVPAVFSTEGISVETAKSITYEDSLSVSGVVLRTETVVTSSNPLVSVDYKVSDGDRVGKGDVLAAYSSSETSSSDRLLLNSLERRIALYSESLSATTQYDLKTLDSKTKDAINAYLDVSRKGNLADSLDAGEDVMSFFIKRDIKATGDTSYYKTILSNCETSKKTILQGSSAQQYTVKSAASGYFTSRYDGYEFLDAADYTSVLPEDLRNLSRVAAQPIPENYVGKLQRSPTWSYLCIVSESDAERFKVGSTWTLVFDVPSYGTQRVSMKVSSVSSPVNGEVSVIFTSTGFNNALFSLRFTDAKIVLQTYSGFRIKRDAIRISEGQSGVYVLSGAKLVFKPVTVLFRSDESDFAVVAANSSVAFRTLLQNDSVVVGGKDIYDGKVVNIN